MSSKKTKKKPTETSLNVISKCEQYQIICLSNIDLARRYHTSEGMTVSLSRPLIFQGSAALAGWGHWRLELGLRMEEWGDALRCGGMSVAWKETWSSCSGGPRGLWPLCSVWTNEGQPSWPRRSPPHPREFNNTYSAVTLTVVDRPLDDHVTSWDWTPRIKRMCDLAALKRENKRRDFQPLKVLTLTVTRILRRALFFSWTKRMKTFPQLLIICSFVCLRAVYLCEIQMLLESFTQNRSKRCDEQTLHLSIISISALDYEFVLFFFLILLCCIIYMMNKTT